MKTILLIGSLRSPPPIRAAPDFHLKVKRLTMICASLALLQIMFAVHPRESVSHDSQVALLPYESCSLATPSGDRINRSMLSCRDMAPWLSIHSAPACGGKVVAPATKGGCISSPAGRLYGFRRQRRHKKWRRRRRTSPVERYFIPPEGGALNPSGRRQPVPDRTLAAQGRKARRLAQPSRP